MILQSGVWKYKWSYIFSKFFAESSCLLHHFCVLLIRKHFTFNSLIEGRARYNMWGTYELVASIETELFFRACYIFGIVGIQTVISWNSDIARTYSSAHTPNFEIAVKNHPVWISTILRDPSNKSWRWQYIRCSIYPCYSSRAEMTRHQTKWSSSHHTDRLDVLDCYLTVLCYKLSPSNMHVMLSQFRKWMLDIIVVPVSSSKLQFEMKPGGFNLGWGVESNRIKSAILER